MGRSSQALLVSLCLGLSLVAGCRGRRPPQTVPQGEEPVGIYRADLVEGDGEHRRFRLWIYAALPDRLHGEVVSPVGTTELIVDAGGGRMAVSFVRERVAYVGPADPAVLEALLGFRVGLGELVRSLLEGGQAPPGLSLERSDSAGAGLPQRLSLRSGARELTLELKRRQALAGPADGLGRGNAPEGMEERPLAELDLREVAEAGSP